GEAPPGVPQGDRFRPAKPAEVAGGMPGGAGFPANARFIFSRKKERRNRSFQETRRRTNRLAT
ncbi:MAG: hypothetical protein RL272_757, partial [Candidatus Parcubacteria bacterium]